MTWTRHENGAGATPIFGRRRRADQLRSAAAASTKCRRQWRGGAQLYFPKVLGALPAAIPANVQWSQVLHYKLSSAPSSVIGHTLVTNNVRGDTAVCGCLATRSKSHVLSPWPTGCMPTLSVTKAPLQLQFAICGAIWVMGLFYNPKTLHFLRL